MPSEKAQIDMDFTESSMDFARQRLHCLHASMLKIWVTENNAMEARRAQGVHGFELVVVPSEIMLSPYAWGASYGGNMFWTKGAV